MTVLREDPLNMIICGVGGQGNVLIASLVGRILHRKGYHVTVGDTYGAAQRGGAVFSSVRISSKKTYGPLVPEGRAHLIVGLEPMETLRLLQKYGNQEVACITNTSAVYPVGVTANGLKYPDDRELRRAIVALSKSARFIDATDMAQSLGLQMALNVIMAGALIGSGLVPLTSTDVQEEMKHFFPRDKIDFNVKAFKMGLDAMRQGGKGASDND